MTFCSAYRSGFKKCDVFKVQVAFEEDVVRISTATVHGQKKFYIC